jgi:hypothetical protein
MPASSLPVLGGILAAVVTAGAVVSWVRRAVIQIRSDRRLRAKARERTLLRQPGRGTLVMEGRIVASGSEGGPPDPCCVVTRREFGCLGGPIVHDVSPFLLETDLGERLTIEVGHDPVVENLGILAEVSGNATDAAPLPSGAPDSIKLLRGRVRVAGVVVAAPGRMAPPPRHSAVVTILSS